jgi:methyl-accepting chemotaxis protein
VEEQTATTREMSRSVAGVAGGAATIPTTVGGLASAEDAAHGEAASTQQASDELARSRSSCARWWGSHRLTGAQPG